MYLSLNSKSLVTASSGVVEGRGAVGGSLARASRRRANRSCVRKPTRDRWRAARLAGGDTHPRWGGCTPRRGRSRSRGRGRPRGRRARGEPWCREHEKKTTAFSRPGSRWAGGDVRTGGCALDRQQRTRHTGGGAPAGARSVSSDRSGGPGNVERRSRGLFACAAAFSLSFAIGSSRSASTTSQGSSRPPAPSTMARALAVLVVALACASRARHRSNPNPRNATTIIFRMVGAARWLAAPCDLLPVGASAATGPAPSARGRNSLSPRRPGAGC